jgi:hypothetical protein
MRVKIYMKNTMRGCGAYYLADHTSCQSALCDSFLSTVEIPLVRINWDGEPSGYAENPDNWIFL